MAREEMLLRAVEMDKAAEMQMSELMVQAAFAPLFDPRKASSMLGQMANSARKIVELSALNSKALEAARAKGSVDSITKLYTALVKQGIIVENIDDV